MRIVFLLWFRHSVASGRPSSLEPLTDHSLKKTNRQLFAFFVNTGHPNEWGWVIQNVLYVR